MQGSLWAVNPRFSTQLFRRGIFRAVGGMHKSDRHKLYTLHKFRPPSPPWLHKTPGGKKGKKDNRLTPQPPSAAAPLAKGSYGGLLSFYPFLLPGPCLGTPHNVGKTARHSHRAANAIQLPNAKSRIVSGHSPPGRIRRWGSLSARRWSRGHPGSCRRGSLCRGCSSRRRG